MNSAQAIIQRVANAEANFIEVVCEITSCTVKEGAKALAVMRKLKVIKLDVGIGRYVAVHGMYMEPDVLRNAINLAP